LVDSVASPQRKRFLKRAALLSASLRLYRIAANMKVERSVLTSYATKLLDDVNVAFNIDPPITSERIAGKELRLTNAIGGCMFKHMTAEDAAYFSELSRAQLLR
jgi:hypothetical protein